MGRWVVIGGEVGEVACDWLAVREVKCDWCMVKCAGM